MINKPAAALAVVRPPAVEQRARASVFPAEDLSGLLTRLQERELELEARNLETSEASLCASPSPVQLAQLHESLGAGYVEMNERGVIKEINMAAAGLLNGKPADLFGQDFFRFMAQEDATRLRSQLQHCGQTRQKAFTELRLLSASGKQADMQLLCLPPQLETKDRFRLLLADVTQIKRAEEKIMRLAAFPTYNPNPVFEFSESGSLIWYNDAALAFARNLGFDHPKKTLPPQTPELVRECFTSKTSLVRHEASIGDRHIYWSFFPIHSGRVVHCYGTDITERLLLEAHLRQSQKLDSAGQLAAGIAHDFNNILTIIQGYTSLLLSQRELPSEMSEPLKQVSAASERAANLTRQLMTFSRKQAAQPRALDLNESIQSLGHMLRRIIGTKITQQFTFSHGLPLIQADPSMIEQIVMNLAMNASDAMPNGGKFTIDTAAVKIDENYRTLHPEARTGDFVCLTVADTGEGMPPEILGKIFEPFFTTKESASGLGLSSVYGIVKQHQGWIEVDSRLGQGSTFKVFLPAAPAPAQPESPPEPSALSGNETILVVEDEPALRELVVRQLRKHGYRILQASSGAEALAIWPLHASEIDLLFTDMVMPDGMTGRDLAETLVAQKPDLQVIYSSGYSMDVVEEDFALRKGAQFLQKPYQPAALVKAIRAALDADKPRNS